VKTVKCNNCGAEVSFDLKTQVLRCEFCGSTYLAEVPQTAAKPWQAEEVIIPLSLTEGDANTKFNEWVKKGLFKPGDLTMMLQRAPLQGIYIPTWNYSFEANTNWAGDKRYTRTISQTNSDGSRSTRTIEEWEPRSGSRHEFYNLFIAASGGLTNQEVDALAPFPLEDAVPYAAEYFAGKQAEVPQKSPEQAWGEAQNIAQEAEERAVRMQVDRITHCSTSFYNEAHRMVYVPIWISGYHYKSKYYRVLINGRTGEVKGKKPVSVLKVLIACGIVAAVIAAIVIIANVVK